MAAKRENIAPALASAGDSESLAGLLRLSLFFFFFFLLFFLLFFFGGLITYEDKDARKSR